MSEPMSAETNDKTVIIVPRGGRAWKIEDRSWICNSAKEAAEMLAWLDANGISATRASVATVNSLALNRRGEGGI